MTQNSTSMAVSSAQVFTAILMGALGNTTAEWGGNSWEDKEKRDLKILTGLQQRTFMAVCA